MDAGAARGETKTRADKRQAKHRGKHWAKMLGLRPGVCNAVLAGLLSASMVMQMVPAQALAEIGNEAEQQAPIEAPAVTDAPATDVDAGVDDTQDAAATDTAEPQKNADKVAHVLHLDANGATGRGDASADAVADGRAMDDVVTDAAKDDDAWTVEVPASTLVRDGYHLTGWSTTPDGKDAVDDPATAWDETLPATDVPLKIKLTNWTFELDTDGDDTAESFDLAYAAKTPEELAEEGAFDEDGLLAEDEAFEDGELRDDDAATVEVVTLYAQWEKDAEPAADDSDAKANAASANTDGKTDEQSVAEDDDKNSTADATESEQNAASEVEDEKADEDVATIPETVTSDTDPAEQAAEGEQADTDATDASDNDAPTMAPEQYSVAGVPMPSALTPVLKVLGLARRASAIDPDHDVTAGDNVTIDAVTSTWKTADNTDPVATDDVLNYRFPNDANTSLRMDLDFTVSGDLSVGSVRVVLPEGFIPRRGSTSDNTSYVGTMSFSVPEDPDTGGQFNYSLVDGQYVLTSTRAFTGTTSVHLEFSVDGVKPDQIANGTVTDPFQPQVQVTTTEGTALQRTSNALTAQFTTWEAIAASYEYGQFLKDAPVAWGEGTAPALPEGKTADDYIYVDWYSYCAVTGNQPYDLNFASKVADYTITNKANGEAVDSSSAIIMGVTTPAANEAVNKDLDAAAVNLDTRINYFRANDSRGWNQYQHVYVAYPKDLFAPDTPYQLTHKSQWTLSPNETTTTDEDGKQVQYTQASLTLNNVTYFYQKWIDPPGFFDVFKWGVDSDGSGRYPDNRYSHVGAYNSALNKLANGSDVDLTYGIQEQAGLYGWTYDEKPGDDEGYYGKTPVTVELSDTGTYFSSDYAHPLTSDQRVVRSIRFESAATYSYGRGNDGKYAYKRDGSLEQPTFTVYGRAGAESEWVSYGTVKGGRVLTVENGATGERTASITLPEGEVTDWKLVTDKTVPGIIMNVWPTITLRAAGISDDGSSTLQERAAAIVASATAESVYVSNKAELRATGAHGEDTGTIQKYGTDKLGAASWGVQMSTSTTKVTNDTSNQQVNIHYRTNVTEPSNLPSRSDYDAAVAEGAIQQDVGGRFYVLLPQGVEPDASSVRASNGDSVESVQTVPNWRGSGRTMMIVTVAHTPNLWNESNRVTDHITIEYDAHCSWLDATQYRNRNLNATGTVAYESDLDQLGTMTNSTGEPDNPTHGNNYQSSNVPAGDVKLVTDLDPDRYTDGEEHNSFVYSATSANVKDLKFTYVTGFSKNVMSVGQGQWGDGRSVAIDTHTGGVYEYSLAASPKDKNTTSSNVVFYDELEAYKPSADSDDAGEREDSASQSWRGTLLRVDTSRLTTLGAAPKVYYSEKDVDLTYENGAMTGDTDLTDGNVWIEAGTYEKTHADLSAVRAVAVDASKKADGSSLTLHYGDFAVVYLYMRAPVADALLAQAPSAADETQPDYTAHAFNNSYTTSNVTDKENDQDNAPTVTPSGYTKLGIERLDIPVAKAWSDAKDQDGIRPDSVEVHLLANGEDTGEKLELSDGNKWTGTFENLTWGDESGNQITYSVSEDAPEGYTPSVSQTSDGGYRVTNIHQPEQVRFRGTKAWDDQDDANGARPDKVTLHLLADGKVVKTVTATAANGWEYDFGNMPKYKLVEGEDGVTTGGHEIAYTVTEDYVPGYIADTADPHAIANQYDPYGEVSVTKTVTNGTSASADKEFPLTLTVVKNGQPVSGAWGYDVKNADGTDATDADGNALSGTVENGDTVSIQAGQTLTVHRVPSEADYEWAEGEVAGFTQASVTDATGTVRAGQTQVASITNDYQTKGSAVVRASKVLTGRTLANRQFRFQLLDSDGNVVKSGTSDADGNIVFSALKYTNADDGVAHTYTMREVDAKRPGYTYDDSEHTVTVTPHDNGDGTMACDVAYAEGDDPTAVPTFNNTYKASGKATLTAYKTIRGGSLSEGQFSFTLHGQDGAPMPKDADGNPVAAATNDATGRIDFPELAFTEADAGKTYVYWATEDKGSDATVSYTSKPVAWTAAVIDNGDGTLGITSTPVRTDGLLDADGNLSADFKPVALGDAPVFTNAYKDGELDITKATDGTGNPNQEFTFKVELTGDQVDENTVKSYQVTDGSNTYGTPNSEATGRVVARHAGSSNWSEEGTRNGNYGNNESSTKVVTIPGATSLSITISYGGESTSYDWACVWAGSHPTYTAYNNWGSSLSGKLGGSNGTKTYTIPGDSVTFAFRSDSSQVGSGLGYHAVVTGMGPSDPSVSAKPQSSGVWTDEGEEPDSLLDMLTSSFDALFRVKTAYAEEDKTYTITYDANGGTFVDGSTMNVVGYETTQQHVTKNSHTPNWTDDGTQNGAYGNNLSTNDVVTIPGAKQLTVTILYGCEDDYYDEDEGETSYYDWACVWEGSHPNYTARNNLWSSVSGRLYGSTNQKVYTINGDTVTFGFVSDSGGTGTGEGYYATITNDPGTVTEGAYKEPSYANGRYSFDGWTTSRNGTKRAMLDDITSDTTLYAKWSNSGIPSGTWGTCPWWITRDGTLHVEAGIGADVDPNSRQWPTFYDCPWYQHIYQIKRVAPPSSGKVVCPSSIRGLFTDCTNLEDISGLSEWDTSHVVKMENVFYNCTSLKSLDPLKDWDMSHVKYMRHLFAICTSVTDASALSDWNTSGATDMEGVFSRCRNLEVVDVSGWSIPSYCKNMFETCPKLRSITFGTNSSNFTSNSANLSPSPSRPYTNNWVREDGSGACTSDQLMGLQAPGPTSIADRAGTWVLETYNYLITLDPNGGIGSMSHIAVDDDPVAIPAPAFTRFGYSFTGWNTKADGAGTAYAPGDSIMPTGDMTLYAQWSEKGSSVSDGRSFEVTIKKGETAKIDGLPAGTAYNVYEETPSGWVLVSSSNTSGTITPLTTQTASFTNSYQPGKVSATITGAKTVDASTTGAAGYEFRLTPVETDSPMPQSRTAISGEGGGFSFAPITFDKAGNYEYFVDEIKGDAANIEYDEHLEKVTVKVDDDGKGNLSATVTTDKDGVAFDNKDITAKAGSLTISKATEGGTDVANEKATFTFGVSYVLNGVTTTLEDVTIRGAGTATVGNIPVGADYTVTEKDIPAGWTLTESSGTTGTISVNPDKPTETLPAQASFTDAYASSGIAEVAVTKVLQGGNLKRGQFTFNLTDADGKVLQTADNQGDGSVAFKVDGLMPGEHVLSVVEQTGTDDNISYSTTPVYAKVTATDNGDGTCSTDVKYYSDAACTQPLDNPTITNSVKTGSLTISKTTTNATETADGKATFSFGVTLSDASGKPVSGTFGGVEFKDGKATVTVDAAGGEGKTTLEGLPAGTTYKVTEAAKDGWSQTSAEGDTGAIGPDAESTVVFSNDYATAGTWTPPTVTKKLTGRELAEGEFTFVLRDGEGNVVDKAANAADGTVNFADVTYATEDDGVAHEYTISEEQGAASNVSYATDTVYVVVTPHDQGDGSMTVDAHYYADAEHLQELSADALVFENEYGVALPNTGRGGFIGLTVAALAAVAGAAAVIVRRKREEDAAAPATGVKGGGLDD